MEPGLIVDGIYIMSIILFISDLYYSFIILIHYFFIIISLFIIHYYYFIITIILIHYYSYHSVLLLFIMFYRKARHHSFIIRSIQENVVICAIVLTKSHVAMVKAANNTTIQTEVHSGNYVGTSKGMEGEAFILSLEQLRQSGLLPLLTTITCDGDSGVPFILRNTEGAEHIIVAGDPGQRRNTAVATNRRPPIQRSRMRQLH